MAVAVMLISNEPNSRPSGLPLPPKMLAPPTTTAVITVSSKPTPVLDCTILKRLA